MAPRYGVGSCAVVRALREKVVTSVDPAIRRTEGKVTVKLRDGRTVTAVTFVVDTAHCQYSGDLPIERAAYHIAFAEGRRGACREYLLNTAEHARSLGIHDPYLEELVERVAQLREEQVPATAVA